MKTASKASPLSLWLQVHTEHIHNNRTKHWQTVNEQPKISQVWPFSNPWQASSRACVLHVDTPPCPCLPLILWPNHVSTLNFSLHEERVLFAATNINCGYEMETLLWTQINKSCHYIKSTHFIVPKEDMWFHRVCIMLPPQQTYLLTTCSINTFVQNCHLKSLACM